MNRTIVLAAMSVAIGCGSNADSDNDGVVESSEFCDTVTTLECQIADNCGDLAQLGFETLEQCYENKTPTCNYLAERCDFSETIARACVTRVSAHAGSCEAGDGVVFYEQFFECEGLFSACQFGES